MSAANIVVLAGFIIGLVYGAVGLLSGFCMMSSLRGWWAEGDGRLVRTYAMAMGIAVAATQLLVAAGLVDIGKSIYLQPSFSAPLMFFGGLLFGYGMVMSNGCGSRALVLLGRGNLRSFVVVIVLGIVAMMTLKGLIAPARIALAQASQITTKVNSVPALLSDLGFSEITARMLAAGWFASGYLGADDFNPTPVVSLTFVAPIADALQYAMLSTGSTLNFGIATVGGVFAGSLITALATGRFHWEGYQSPRHMLRSAGGAALMGAGGVMALGCSIGQGLTGFSTLALASFIAVAGIMAGTALGLRGALRVRPLPEV